MILWMAGILGVVAIVIVSGCVSSPLVVVGSNCDPGQVVRDGECLYSCETGECILVESLGCCAYDVINKDYQGEHYQKLAVVKRDCSNLGVCADVVYGASAVCEAGVCVKQVNYPQPLAEERCNADSDCTVQKIDNCCGQKAINKEFFEPVPQVCDAVCPDAQVACVTGQCVLLL